MVGTSKLHRDSLYVRLRVGDRATGGHPSRKFGRVPINDEIYTFNLSVTIEIHPKQNNKTYLVGIRVGPPDGFLVGSRVGSRVGILEGSRVGIFDGSLGREKVASGLVS